MPGPGVFTDEFYQILKELTILYKLLKKKRRQQFSNNFMRPVLNWHKNQNHHKERILQIFLMNMFAKILNKVLTNWIHQQIKRIVHHDQVGFMSGMQDWFNI